MPTYDYLCRDCGHRFERFEAISGGGERPCPRCGGSAVRQIGGGGAILIRGHGPSGRAGCDRTTPCCGRDERCDTPPCGER
jgi:putative FmdB family regulatory protein